MKNFPFLMFPPKARLASGGNVQKRKSGFTLMETVVALAVILAALVGPVSLVTRGIIDVTFAKNRLIALNLAQEGIELVRLARDNNVLCDFLDGGAIGSWKWDHEAGGGVGNLIDPQPEGVPTALRVDSTNLEIDTCGPSNVYSADLISVGSNPPLEVDGNGIYQYGSGDDSPFRRVISVDIRTVSGRTDRMDVTATVTWTDRGRARSVVLRDALYNWR